MDHQYIKALDLIINVKIDLQKIYNNADCKGLENAAVNNSLDELIEELEKTQYGIEYYSRPAKEGCLTESNNGKFKIEYTNGNSSYPLGCGSSLEIYDNEKGWKIGRVEHNTNKGYYFYNRKLQYPALYPGMKARLRVND